MLKTIRLVAAGLLAAGVWITTPACASGVYEYRDRGYDDVGRRAYENGHREGVERGRDDARDGRGFRIDRDRDFRERDEGYRGNDRAIYWRAFREGYEAGYTEAYNREARSYGRDGRYDGRSYSPAAQNGHRDGFEAGRTDARDRQRFDPVSAKRYREGDHDYDRRYGSRDDYKREYRAAFEQGYRDGYGGR